MEGKRNSRTMEPFTDSLQKLIHGMDCSQLIHRTVADVSQIRGVNPPMPLDKCMVPDLRNYCAARGGIISLPRRALLLNAKCYQFIEKQVSKSYVDRHPNKSGSLYESIYTGSKSTIEEMLDNLRKSNAFQDDRDIQGLIKDTCFLYDNGHFDDNYDNIARVAPELKQEFLYKEFCHIGQSTTSKVIGDALRRCWYETETLYHAIAFVPDTDRVIILSKAHASMKLDEKTRCKDKEQATKKREYLVMMELHYDKTSEYEAGHKLGVFVRLGRSYCTACIAGQGLCRHQPESA